jgi:hypothetical protein
MDGNTLSPADVMLMTKQHCNRGMAATGVGLAAGLGGGALLLAIGLGWGLNQASKARAKAAEQAVAGNQNALNMMSQFMLTERNSRETWQNVHTPTIKQYVDVSSTAQQGQQSTTSATAEALALAAAINQNNGINSAIGNESFLRVQRYSAPQPCGCDTCGN